MSADQDAGSRPGSESHRGRRRGRTALIRVILLAALVFTAVAFFQVRSLLRGRRLHAVGDGRDVATYGFTLEPCLISLTEIVAAGMPKDTLLPLDFPPLMTASAVDSLNAAERGKYLVPDDLVIGVERGGVARAYPLRVLNWHEVANDTLGGLSLAVTYHPLCGSSVVFASEVAREVAGEPLSFGVSGLLYNSNLLLYDRRPEAVGESLWSQLQARAVAGPAAARGDTLTVLPHLLTSWAAWRAAHPHTTVPVPSDAMSAAYKRRPYGHYEGSDKLHFPVEPLPPVGGRRYMQRIVARAGEDGWEVREWAGPRRVAPSAEAGRAPVIHSYWFAWYALRE